MGAQKQSLRLARLFAVLALAGGLTSLMGWIFAIPALVDWDGNGISIKTNAAIAVMLASASALLLAARPIRPALVGASRVLAAVATALGGVTLAQHLFGLDLGIDMLVFTEPAGARATAAPNRMGIPASTCFALLGPALVLLGTRRPALHRIALGLGASTLIVSSLSLIGHGFQAEELFDVAGVSGIAAQTALLLHCLSWAVCALAVDRGVRVVLVRRGPGGALARERAVIAVVVPLLLGYGGLELERSGAVSAPLVAALSTLLTILVFLAFIMRTARAVDAAAAAQGLSEARYRTAFDEAPIGVVEIDPETAVVLRANEAYCQIVGRPASAVTGHPSSEWTHEDDRAGDAAALADARAHASFARHKRYVRPDGSIVRARVAGRIVSTADVSARVLTMVSDVTAEATAADRIRESEERFRASLEGSPTCVYMNDADLRYVWIYNPLPGVDAEAIIGRRDDELQPLAAVAELMELKREVLRTGVGQRRQIDAHINGAFVSFDVKVEPWRNSAGAAAGVLVAASNITPIREAVMERLKLLESERAARTEAERAARSKDDFVAMMSHELRTPLNSIQGWSHLLKQGTLAAAEQIRAVEAIERGVRNQARLIDDLLDMSRMVSGKLRVEVQRVDVIAAVMAALDAIRPAASAKQIVVQTALDAECGPVMGDADRLQQITWNLLSNAVKFTPPKGTIQLAVQRAGAHVEIIVSDTGYGIAPTDVPHVFERYRQGARSTAGHGGLGLGLAIVRSLVELHGGTVAAESAGEGLGATFTVRIPVTLLAPDQADHRHLTPTFGDLREGRLVGVRVLVVDDDEDALELANRMLTEHGAKVDQTTSAREALVRVDADPPDLMMSDLGMPDVDGYELIRRVRAKHPRLPALAVTAFARAEDRMRALEAGYDMHLAKPVNALELLTVVSALTRKHPERATARGRVRSAD